MLRDDIPDSVAVPELFRHAVERIMTDAAKREITMGERPEEPRSHGWLRRSDLDRDGREAWELPDGAIRLTITACPAAMPRSRSSTPPGA